MTVRGDLLTYLKIIFQLSLLKEMRTITLDLTQLEVQILQN